MIVAAKKDVNSNEVYITVDHHVVTISYIGNLTFSGECECGITKVSATHLGIRQHIHREHLKIEASTEASS